jgi:hypothetical protein
MNYYLLKHFFTLLLKLLLFLLVLFKTLKFHSAEQQALRQVFLNLLTNKNFCGTPLLHKNVCGTPKVLNSLLFTVIHCFKAFLRKLANGLGIMIHF